MGCAAALAAVALLPYGWFRWESLPVSGSTQPVAVDIPPGAHSATIAHLLESRGVIRSAPVFLWTARFRGAAARFRPGEYHLAPAMTLDQIMERLQRGGSDADEKSVTIPEGFTVAQIADRLAARGVVRDAGDFIETARGGSPALTAPFPLPAQGLEGYLFPETYRLRPNTPPDRVAQTMLDAFTSRFYERHKADVERSGHSLNEIVTIASLIERETDLPDERARIAGVIENRLKRRMLLNIDATVLYALGHHKTRVLYRDLRVDSPYNTYRHRGLPPGPIASPGLPSLEAALAPEQNDFLFYVAGPDGRHIFTRTEAEHNATVARVRAQTRAAGQGG